jgi:acetyl esterase
MALDPQIAEILELVQRAQRPPLWALSPQQAREAYRKSAKVLEIPAIKLHRIEDFNIPARDGYDLPLRLYAPRSVQTDETLPLLLYFHGGGFTIGGIETHDNVCRMFAKEADCLVVSVDYRLAPEFRFPFAVDDAWDALQWVRSHVKSIGADPARIALGGDSAGGNLAAVTAIRARDDRSLDDTWAPVLQLLIYPRTSWRVDWPSHLNNAEGYLLDAPLIAWFFQQYVALAQQTEPPDWRLAPLDGVDQSGAHVSLQGVAPACIVVAGYDPLHDEGLAYAERLQAAGVRAQVHDYSGMVHGFLNFGGYVDVARQAHCAMVEVFKAYFKS